MGIGQDHSPNNLNPFITYILLKTSLFFKLHPRPSGNQLSKPLLRIFEPILGDKAEGILLKGDHTRAVTVVHSKAGALAAFTKKKATCVGCKAVLKREGSAVCDSCKGKASDIYQKEISQLYNLEEKFNR